MKILPAVLLTLFCFGCASIGIRDDSLELQIKPLPILRGKSAYAQVNASMDSQRVVGTVLVMGSPQLIFRKDEDKGVWYFLGTIPFSPWVKPGTYIVRVSVEGLEGKPRYTEMKVDLK